jgi:DNA-binding GntR family transcriptional regulator
VNIKGEVVAKRDRSARDSAYQQLREQILTMALAPGAKIDEQGLAAELGSSRTPVREALGQLAAEGLIDSGERGGYHVSSIDLTSCRDLLEAQMMVARTTTHLLVARLDATGIELLRRATESVDAAVAANDPALIARRNAELHTLESSLGGNRYITSLSEQIYTHSQRLAYMSFKGEGPLSNHLTEHYDKVCIDHWDYLKALEARDLKTAEDVATRHVQLFQSRIVSYFTQDHLAAMDYDGLIA